MRTWPARAEVVIEDFPGSEYFQKINTLAAGGTMGDVIWISSIEGYFRLAATGVLAPIDDIVESLGYDLEEHYPATISAAYLNGQLYGIPILAHPGRVGLFYNKTIFDDAGVDYPDETWTMDDFLAAAIAVTDPERRIWGFVDPEGSYFTSIVFIRAFGGDTLSADGATSLLNSEESIAALKFQSSLYNEHMVAPAPGTALQGPYPALRRQSVGDVPVRLLGQRRRPVCRRSEHRRRGADADWPLPDSGAACSSLTRSA